MKLQAFGQSKPESLLSQSQSRPENPLPLNGLGDFHGRLRIPDGYEPEPALRWNVSVGLRRADDALVAAVDTAVARVVEQRIPAQIYAKYGITYLPPSAEGLQ
jgi:hypothetical protein